MPLEEEGGIRSRGTKEFPPSLWVPPKQLPSRECFLPAAKPSGLRTVRVVVVVVVVGGGAV